MEQSKLFPRKSAPKDKWCIVKDLKGMPSHRAGGVNLKVEDGKVKIQGKDGQYQHAEFGMVLEDNKRKKRMNPLDAAFKGVDLDDDGYVIPKQKFKQEYPEWGPDGNLYPDPGPGNRRFYKKQNIGVGYWTPKKTIFGNLNEINGEKATEESNKKFMDDQRRYAKEDRQYKRRASILFSRKFKNKGEDPIDAIKRVGKEKEFNDYQRQFRKDRISEGKKIMKDAAELEVSVGYANMAGRDHPTGQLFAKDNTYYDIDARKFKRDGIEISPKDAITKAKRNVYGYKPGLFDPIIDRGIERRYQKLRREQSGSINPSLRTQEENDRAIEEESKKINTTPEFTPFPSQTVSRRAKDTDNFYKERQWVSDWYSSPASQKKALEMGISQGEQQRVLNRIDLGGDYVVDPDLPLKKKGYLGSMNPFTREIEIYDDSRSDLQVHEITHLGSMADQQAIRDVINKVVLNNPGYAEYINKYVPMNSEEGYKYNPDEIYSRIMQLRRSNNITPGQVVKSKDIKGYNPEDYYGMDKNQMIYLLNKVVKNDTKPKYTPLNDPLRNTPGVNV